MVTTEEPRVVRARNVALTLTGGEAVLVDEEHGSVHVVNHTAASLWELCASEPTIPELVEALAGAYGLEGEAVRGDVEQIVGAFRELRLLDLESKRADPAPTAPVE